MNQFINLLAVTDDHEDELSEQSNEFARSDRQGYESLIFTSYVQNPSNKKYNTTFQKSFGS